MGKAARWLRSFLGAGGKKDAKRDGRATTHAEAPLPNPKEKIRWSFRRPVVLPAAEQQDAGAGAGAGASRPRQAPESETVVFDQKKHAVTAAADMAAATVVRLSSRSKAPPASIILAEAAAAVRIQATFRGYLARTALCALRGIVKLQAVVRGQLVRKQAKATLRCMQALLAAQSQLRAQRLRFLQIQDPDQPPPRPRQHPRHRRPSYETDMRSCEENAKAVETDYSGGGAKGDRHRQCSPAPSSGMTTELSPTRASSWHLEASSSPQSQNVSAGTEQPSYMGNTESSRAKVRSQSAPRQRAMAMDAHALLERQPSGRRKGAEHRSVPRGARMQRSSSQQQQQHCGSGSSSSFFRPWSSSVKLDSSSASLRDRDRDRDSECGSTTSSVLTAATTVYSRTRSLVGLEVRRGLY